MFDFLTVAAVPFNPPFYSRMEERGRILVTDTDTLLVVEEQEGASNTPGELGRREELGEEGGGGEEPGGVEGEEQQQPQGRRWS